MIPVLLWGLKGTMRRVLPGALTFPTPLLSVISCTGEAPDSHIQRTGGQKRSRGCSGSTKQSALWAPWPVPSCVRREEGFLGMAKARPHSTVLQGHHALPYQSPTPGPDPKPPSPLKSPGKVNIYPSTNELSTLEVYIFIPRSPKSQIPNFIHNQIPTLSL